MRFYSDLFHGIGESIRFLGIDYTPSRKQVKQGVPLEIQLCQIKVGGGHIACCFGEQIE